jgi:hypothetical protein
MVKAGDGDPADESVDFMDIIFDRLCGDGHLSLSRERFCP